jgi:hypothetical protein
MQPGEDLPALSGRQVMPRLVAFRCRTCGEAATVPTSRAGAIVGSARSAFWLAKPGRGAGDPQPPATAPAVGEEHVLVVGFPFQADLEQPFWLLYQPPRVVLNGWDDCPDEIVSSALIQCSPVEVTDFGTDRASIRVRVSDRVMVPEIAGKLPVTQATTALLRTYDDHHGWLSRSGRYTHLSINIESDAGSWTLVERRDGDDFIVLGGDWGWHVDTFAATNLRLTADDTRILARLADRQRFR